MTNEIRALLRNLRANTVIRAVDAEAMGRVTLADADLLTRIDAALTVPAVAWSAGCCVPVGSCAVARLGALLLHAHQYEDGGSWYWHTTSNGTALTLNDAKTAAELAAGVGR